MLKDTFDQLIFDQMSINQLLLDQSYDVLVEDKEKLLLCVSVIVILKQIPLAIIGHFYIISDCHKSAKQCSASLAGRR